MKSIFIIVLSFMVAASIGLCGCGQPSDTNSAASRDAPAPDSISIFYTCDTRGHINPCNCTAGVAGGLPRRKTFISQHSFGDALVVDVGNLTAGGRPWELLEFDYILRGYREIGYDAVNIGKREVELPLSALTELSANYPFLLSTNVHDLGGRLIFPPFRVVTLQGGYRAAIIGVTDNNVPPDEIGEGVTILPPEEAIAKALPGVSAEADFIVLLAFVGELRLKELAERFFEIDVIVGGDVKQPSGEAMRANQTTIVYITDKGKSVGELGLRYVGGKYIAEKNSITMLMEDVEDDPGMAALVAELHRKLVENNYPTKKDDEDGLSTL